MGSKLSLLPYSSWCPEALRGTLKHCRCCVHIPPIDHTDREQEKEGGTLDLCPSRQASCWTQHAKCVLYRSPRSPTTSSRQRRRISMAHSESRMARESNEQCCTQNRVPEGSFATDVEELLFRRDRSVVAGARWCTDGPTYIPHLLPD
jgi:hypothetical protein